MTDTTIRHITSVFPVNADAVKPDPKSHRRRSIVREFSLNTSTHGIPGIARSESLPNRIFWTIALLCFTSTMLYFIIQSIQAYFGYPTQTSVSFSVQRLQPFPAVTICNYSPIRFDTFIEPYLNYTNPRNLTNTSDTTTLLPADSAYIRDFLQDQLNHGKRVTDILFPLSPMLLLCQYNGVECNSSDFITFASSTYGMCYTFNAQMKSSESHVRLTTENGHIGKLELRLYAHSQQYVPYVAEDVSVGMMAMIHDNTELPLIETAGIQLAPGRKHKLSYKKKTNQLLSSPYTDCTEKVPLVMQAMFDQYEGADYAYSQVICNLLCVQTYVYQECNCVSPYQWTAQSIVLPGTNTIFVAPICDVRNLCFANATSRITNTMPIWDQFCSDCRQSCSSVDFTVTTSSVAAPSIEYIYFYKDVINQSSIPLPTNWSEIWQTEIPKNYISVEFVCETSRVEVYTQSATLSGVDVISNVGGQTGLWIGISFLSLMELVEMLYRLIRYQCHLLWRYIRKREEKKNNEQTE